MKTFYAVVTLILISALPIYAGKWSTGTTAPATCALGDSWTDTNGTADNRFYTCTATNTWTLNSNQTAIDTKANKSGSVMLWSEYGGGASFDTTSPQVSYNGAFYKCINPYVKTLGEYPDTQTEYFEEVTGAGGAGDIEGVTAGTGLSGGGVSGTVTLSADTTYLQRRVSSTCSAGSSIREIAADGTVTCETDDTGSGSVPDGTVNGQVLLWATDQWVANTAPWLTTSSLGDGVASALGYAPDTSGGFLLYSSYADDPTLAFGTGLTATTNAGVVTLSVTANTYQAYDANMIAWPSAVSATEVGYLDGLTGAISTSLGAKLNVADIDDTAVNGETTQPISSNWAYDHAASTAAHGATGEVVGTTNTQTLTNKSLTSVEVDGSSSVSLTAAQVSNTVVTNRGQAAADVALGLPTAVAGYAAVFTVGTTQSNKWGVQAGASDKIYLIAAAAGTVTAGADNGYARMTAAQVGQAFACWTFQTGVSEWDWMCKAGSIGTSTFAAN